jgi:hypothetical protein
LRLCAVLIAWSEFRPRVKNAIESESELMPSPKPSWLSLKFEVENIQPPLFIGFVVSKDV